MEDEGPGIPRGLRPTYLNDSDQERPKEEKFGTHSGLGLDISKQIVELMAVGFSAETEFPNKVRCSVPVLLSNYRSPHSIVAKSVSLNQRRFMAQPSCFGINVLLRGPSGAGKSDLALRLIDCGAVLVADDRVNLTRAKDSVQMSAPANLLGKLEIRGLGIVQMACVPFAPLAMVCDLILRRSDRSDT